MVTGQQRERKWLKTKYILQGHDLNHLLPPTRPHQLKIVLHPLSTLGYALIHGLIHWWDQSPQEPIISQRTHSLYNTVLRSKLVTNELWGNCYGFYGKVLSKKSYVEFCFPAGDATEKWSDRESTNFIHRVIHCWVYRWMDNKEVGLSWRK
jgi:hypothetical protein